MLPRWRSPWMRRTRPARARSTRSGWTGAGGAAGASASLSSGRCRAPAEGGDVLVDIARERLDPRSASTAGAAACAAATRPSASASAASILPASASLSRVACSSKRRISTAFHRRAGAVEGEAAVLLARDRHHATIDLGSKRPVDLEFRLARRLRRASGIVEERKAHRTLDLVGTLAGEEHRGRMRVDALDLAAAVGRRVGEQREYRLLAFALRHPPRNPCRGPPVAWH